ncbi:heavy-metal-associated domain-containing protein [Microvirga arsenatis]|uniref:Copper chaperone n=1 Tax=Microvirga arsenatis TaxID=2692265 RepID=A0ABW9Z8A4_9HYPH|nr:heavy-metal-associated domain-containing protein [Microvirga arsenatis]NBJ13118.1 copper chaperone [Microvirga arsenatis]NBJ26869.1 copper chaperone [Microvirga arsenatis]
MCGCSAHQSQQSQAAEREPTALALRLEDMTCSHCAGAITKAVEAGLRGVKVEADPASKLVHVRGTSDLAAVRSLIAEADFTPSAAGDPTRALADHRPFSPT